MPVDHYENFPVASLVLPKRFRPAVIAIYRFARTADDFADEGTLAPEERLARLGRLREGLRTIGSGATPADEPLATLAGAIRSHDLPLAPFHALLDAFSQDVTTPRYATFEALLDYCRRSANPIGRLLLALYRADTPANLEKADAVCTALQLVNFWQDVAIDWAKGRVYVPEEDLARFGIDETQIAAQRADRRWAALMAFEVERARRMLVDGRTLARALGGRLGLELRLIVAGGARICRLIDRVDGDVFRRRPRLRPLDWPGIVLSALKP